MKREKKKKKRNAKKRRGGEMKKGRLGVARSGSGYPSFSLRYRKEGSAPHLRPMSSVCWVEAFSLKAGEGKRGGGGKKKKKKRGVVEHHFFF